VGKLTPEHQRLLDGLARLAERTRDISLFVNPIVLPTRDYFPEGGPRTIQREDQRLGS
jgi:hypothetical protein